MTKKKPYLISNTPTIGNPDNSHILHQSSPLSPISIQTPIPSIPTPQTTSHDSIISFPTATPQPFHYLTFKQSRPNTTQSPPPSYHPTIFPNTPNSTTPHSQLPIFHFQHDIHHFHSSILQVNPHHSNTNTIPSNSTFHPPNSFQSHIRPFLSPNNRFSHDQYHLAHSYTIHHSIVSCFHPCYSSIHDWGSCQLSRIFPVGVVSTTRLPILSSFARSSRFDFVCFCSHLFFTFNSISQ